MKSAKFEIFNQLLLGNINRLLEFSLTPTAESRAKGREATISQLTTGDTVPECVLFGDCVSR